MVLDTNLLVLLIVGSTSREYIGIHKRLQEYTVDDFDLLSSFISSAKEIVVTPNTLTETSNLIGYIREPARTAIFQRFRVIINVVEERYLESKRAAQRNEFLRLGLTDAVLLETVDTTHTLLTADLDLYLAAAAQGARALNFNHYRNYQ